MDTEMEMAMVVTDLDVAFGNESFDEVMIQATLTNTTDVRVVGFVGEWLVALEDLGDDKETESFVDLMAFSDLIIEPGASVVISDSRQPEAALGAFVYPVGQLDEFDDNALLAGYLNGSASVRATVTWAPRIIHFADGTDMELES